MTRKGRHKPVPVIDLFAGPGGLGEGFTRSGDGRHFEVRLSVEKDSIACETLRLRKFFHAFHGDAPREYYELLGRDPDARNKLAELYPEQTELAHRAVLELEMGNGPTERRVLDGAVDRALRRDARRPWVLIGGPPCQAYSLVGRARNRGIKDYSAADDHRHFLYREYLRILAKYRPAAFVLENVKGLLSSKIDGQHVFERMLADLSDPEASIRSPLDKRSGTTYRIHSLVTGLPLEQSGPRKDWRRFLVESERYGIPQTRHRVILVGLRTDLHASLVPLRRSEAPTLMEVIGDLPPLRSSISPERDDSLEAWRDVLESARGRHDLPNHRQLKLDRGAEFVPGKCKPAALAQWLHDPRLGGVWNHAARGHMKKDLERYLFCAEFARAHGVAPGLDDFPRGLLPAHQNARPEGRAKPIFNDRFRVQLPDAPATTITSHISKDGHYFIHPDPQQCRSLTVREAARIQTFPDNYFFSGGRTAQYHQVGNAVPPFLAKIIAARLYEAIS